MVTTGWSDRHHYCLIQAFWAEPAMVGCSCLYCCRLHCGYPDAPPRLGAPSSVAKPFSHLCASCDRNPDLCTSHAEELAWYTGAFDDDRRNDGGHISHISPLEEDGVVMAGLTEFRGVRGVSWTSMIGNSQGETEIPLDLAEGVLPTGNAFA
jgi:hypothetical protein